MSFCYFASAFCRAEAVDWKEYPSSRMNPMENHARFNLNHNFSNKIIGATTAMRRKLFWTHAMKIFNALTILLGSGWNLRASLKKTKS